mgnify:CR=1 FL=1
MESMARTSQAEAQRQANLSLPEAGDLYIVGDKESLVYVNDRLLGALPLLLPLRVAAGNLSVTLQSGGRTSRGKVEVPAGQAREMRFDELTGAVLVEVIFDWPGLGMYVTNAILALDFPVIMAVTLLGTVVYVLINLAVDLVQAAIDPRISLNG